MDAATDAPIKCIPSLFAHACLRDGYQAALPLIATHKVFQSSGGCSKTGQAIAATPNWFAVVWLDAKTAGVRQVPWLVFNASTAALPVVTR